MIVTSAATINATTNTPTTAPTVQGGDVMAPFPGTIPFWKMSGSGNDFVVVDNRAEIIADDQVGAFTRAVCRHRLSVGADGVVLIGYPPSDTDYDAHFTWRYVNADGTDGEFCGNGAMCGARFAVLNGITPRECQFVTPSGLTHVRVAVAADDPRVTLTLSDPDPMRELLDVVVHNLDERELTLHLGRIRVGVPHAVLLVDDIDRPFSTQRRWASVASETQSMLTPSPVMTIPAADPEFIAIGRAVRRHPVFAPDGTNLNAVQVIDEETVLLRTYERGVEDETLACGSGAVSVAVITAAHALTRPPVTVITRSGRSLRVDFTWDAASRRATNVLLTGEARVIAIGWITSEALA